MPLDCPRIARKLLFFFFSMIVHGTVYRCSLVSVFVYQFFLQLQQAAVSLGDEVVVGCLGLTEVGRLASLEGSLFEGLLALLERLKGDMMGRLLEWTMREIIEKAKPYCHDR